MNVIGVVRKTLTERGTNAINPGVSERSSRLILKRKLQRKLESGEFLLVRLINRAGTCI